MATDHFLQCDDLNNSSDVDPLNPDGLRGFLVAQRRKHNMLQGDIANNLHMTVRHYRSLESGATPIHPDVLERLVDVLDMPQSARRQLYRLAVQHDPPAMPRGVLLEHDDVTRIWIKANVEPLTNPTFFSDGCGRIIASNRAYQTMWEDVEAGENHPTTSFLRFALFHPQADDILVDRISAWVPVVLGKLVMAGRLFPDNRYLYRLWESIRADSGLATVRPEVPTPQVNAQMQWSRCRIRVSQNIRGIQTSSVKPLHGRELGYQSTTFELVDPV